MKQCCLKYFKVFISRCFLCRDSTIIVHFNAACCGNEIETPLPPL